MVLSIFTTQLIRAGDWRKPEGSVKSAPGRRMMASASCTTSYPKLKSTNSSVLTTTTTNSQFLLLCGLWQWLGATAIYVCILPVEASLTGYSLNGEELGRRVPHAFRLVLARVGQDLDGAAAVPAQRLEEPEARGDLSGVRRHAGQEDSQGHAVFDALGSALALV